VSEWVPLDAASLSPARRQRIRGVDITVVMSPYDVPEAVRGQYDEDIHCFVIEFRYMGDEQWVAQKHDDKITLRVGRHSGRLYGIEVNVDALKAHRINLRLHLPRMVMNAIDSLKDQPLKAPRRENYQVAKDAISQKEQQIFESLAAV
jgi:hypothetical protein